MVLVKKLLRNSFCITFCTQANTLTPSLNIMTSLLSTLFSGATTTVEMIMGATSGEIEAVAVSQLVPQTAYGQSHWLIVVAMAVLF